MNKVYLHSKDYLYDLFIKLLLLFSIFILYGFYKNGIILYRKNLVGFFELLKPLIFIFISVIESVIYSKTTNDKLLNFNMINNILIGMIIGPNTSLYTYIPLIIIGSLLYRYLKINVVSLLAVINIIINHILEKPMFLNLYEASGKFEYSFIDILFGREYGGTSNTLLILTIISFGILSTNIIYKKEIPLSFLISYYLLLIIKIFIGNISLNDFFNNNICFAAIFIAPIIIYSPYSKKGCIIYGILLGILTFIFGFINADLGVYIGVTLVSIYAYITNYLVIFKKSLEKKGN